MIMKSSIFRHLRRFFVLKHPLQIPKSPPHYALNRPIPSRILHILQQKFKMFDVGVDQLFTPVGQTTCARFKVLTNVEKEGRSAVADVVVGFDFVLGTGESVNILNQSKGGDNGAEEVGIHHVVS